MRRAAGSRDFQRRLEYASENTSKACKDPWFLLSRVGVRKGAFRAHLPIGTQTRDTRLLCDRSFAEEDAADGFGLAFLRWREREREREKSEQAAQ